MGILIPPKISYLATSSSWQLPLYHLVAIAQRCKCKFVFSTVNNKVFTVLKLNFTLKMIGRNVTLTLF